jgi:rod shape-determining protein MreB
VPILALLRTGEDKWRVAAFGQEAQMTNGEPNIHLMNAFAHQRPIIADVVLAQQTMKYFMRSLGPNSIFSPSPDVVMHPLWNLEGGFTETEIRTLRELALACGARKAGVWQGRQLTAEELRNVQFSDSDLVSVGSTDAAG